MTVAVDSSGLIAIFKNERTGAAWLDFLLHLRAENQLLACDVVWAELAPLFRDLEMLEQNMSALGVAFSPLDEAAAFEAGRLFVRYRQRGGGRGRMIPDFIIAGHALRHGASLATSDHDFMKAQFPSLRILRP
jgi:predicted nucleic acid-binding protein